MSDPDLTAERGPRAALGADFIIPVLACGLTGYYFVSTLDLVWEAKATGIFIGCMLLALCAAQFGLLGLRIGTGVGGFGLGALTENTLFNRQRLALVVLVALFVDFVVLKKQGAHSVSVKEALSFNGASSPTPIMTRFSTSFIRGIAVTST